jgi:hypothetical protein
MEQQTTNLFKLWFDEPKLNQAARIITGRLLKEYGYEKVKEAFLEAASKEQYKLAYVRGILVKKAEAEAIKKNKAEAAKLKQSAERIEQSNVGGFDFSEFRQKAKPKTDESYKETEEYKKSKQQFLNDLKGTKK